MLLAKSDHIKEELPKNGSSLRYVAGKSYLVRAFFMLFLKRKSLYASLY
jgi:hypothetical protein